MCIELVSHAGGGGIGLADLLCGLLLFVEEGIPIITDRVAVEFGSDRLGDDIEAPAVPDLDGEVDGPSTIGGDGEIGADHKVHGPVHGVSHEFDHTMCAGLDVRHLLSAF